MVEQTSGVVNVDESLDEVLDSLDTWLELGDALPEKLLTRREELFTEIEERRRRLRQINLVLGLLGKGKSVPDASAPHRRRRCDFERTAAVIEAVLSSRPDGLRSGDLAELVVERDEALDRYDVHQALPRMVKGKGKKVVAMGSRGAYIYKLNE